LSHCVRLLLFFMIFLALLFQFINVGGCQLAIFTCRATVLYSTT